MSKREKQTSFRLSEEEDSRYKKLAKDKGITFNKLVREALASAHASPDFLNPTTTPTEWENILQKLKEAQKESIQQQDPVITEIIENQKRLEAKIDSVMDKFDVEQPVKDKSGKRVFDE